jgi:SAM-dependent methyltransferase
MVLVKKTILKNFDLHNKLDKTIRKLNIIKKKNLIVKYKINYDNFQDLECLLSICKKLNIYLELYFEKFPSSYISEFKEIVKNYESQIININNKEIEKNGPIDKISNFYEMLIKEMKNTNINSNEKRFMINYYKNRTFSKIFYIKKTRDLIELIMKTKKKKIITDLGCGIGTEGIFLALLGNKIYCVDIDKYMINIAKQRKEYFEKKLKIKLDITFVIFDYQKYIQKEKSDIVILKDAMVLNKPRPKIKFFQNINYLKKKGHLFISNYSDHNGKDFLNALVGFDVKYKKIANISKNEGVYNILARKNLHFGNNLIKVYK